MSTSSPHDAADWSRLLHAYGRATDTPGHLQALLEGDEAARKQALSHLWSAILHQGTACPATGPVARVLAQMVGDARLDHVEVEGQSLRADLLEFLASVAEVPARSGVPLEELEQMAAADLAPFFEGDEDEQDALYEDEDAANAVYALGVLSCMQVVPELLQTMLDGLSHAEARVRVCAAMGAVRLASVASLRAQAAGLDARLQTLIAAASHSDERAALMLSLGELGGETRAYLTDPSPAVRLCAALAPALVNDEAAQRELLQALCQAGAIDGWFAERPPQFRVRPRFYAVTRVLEGIRDFDRLIDAAEAMVRVTDKRSVDFDWGLLLAAAFPQGDGHIGRVAQRRYLQALVDRSELWDPRYGNAQLWFRKAGLPYDREQCRARVASASMD